MHVRADELLLEALEKAGHPEIAQAFREVRGEGEDSYTWRFWYA